MAKTKIHKFSVAWWNEHFRDIYKRRGARELQLRELTEFKIQISLAERSKLFVTLDTIKVDEHNYTIRGVPFSLEQLDALCRQLVGTSLIPTPEESNAQAQTAVPVGE